MRIASIGSPSGYSGIGGTGVKVAFNVTALLGMVKVQGLLEQAMPV
jgi:hypothetical protein